jgi:pilus assembly protein CpaE
MTMAHDSATELPNWRARMRNLSAEILLSAGELAGWDHMVPQIAGFDVRVTMLDPSADVPAAMQDSANVLILEVRRDSRASLERLVRVLKEHKGAHVIAAVRDPSVADARSLLRAGAADILSLPLQEEELEATLGQIRALIEVESQHRGPAGKVVSVVKSVGGVGATALLTQIAAIHAAAEAAQGRETCLIDLDIQFGTAALYLGALPKLGLQDLIDAGARADGSLLRSTTSQHASGLQFIAAPPDLIPLEAVEQDQVSTILDLATREFSTVFIDLPPSWTNWSLSALARSNLILLVTELSVAGLHQARRQLDFIKQHELGDIPLRILLNRVEKRLFKSIDLSDAVKVLGRNVDFTVSEDKETVPAALDQGELISSINPRSRVARDLHAAAQAMTELLVGAA